MREVVFVDFARTAFTGRGGALRTFTGAGLAATALKGLVEKSGIWEKGGPNAVDAVFTGSAFHSKETVALSRYATLLAGFPDSTEAHTVEMQCGSAITGINHAAWQIALGYTDVAIAGGSESHSTRPVYMSSVVEPYMGMAPRWLDMHLSPETEQDISFLEIYDGMAEKWGISREACDEFALRSRQRLEAACASGLVGDEIMPVVIPGNKRTPDVVVSKDEIPGDLTTMEALSAMTPVREGGVSTVGNTSGLNDGAAYVLMMTTEKAKAYGFVPYARWVVGADIGVEPRYMGIGPAFSNLKALKMAGLAVKDMDVWECNEASAAQNLSVIREIETRSGQSLDRTCWNPNGGAIALGHPNGASGARIAMFAMKQLEKTGGKYGIISACCGGGHGTTTIIENLRR